jgi:opacity protein-like surface antigen
MRLKLTLAALAATAAFASPAAAQVVSSNAQAEARGTILQPLTLNWVQDLDFGTILVDPLGTGGTVTIDADNGNRSVAGDVAEVGVNGGQRAVFTGGGPAGDPVQLVLAQPAGGLLYRDATTSLGGVLVLDQGNLTARTFDAGGAIVVGVGGTFTIANNQPAGVYAADFDLTAIYQ